MIASMAVVAIALLTAAPTQALDPIVALRDYSLTNWSEDEGPFPFGVYAIAQDREGYLWLGTRTGLLRFDGSNFRPWRGSDLLPDDRISVIIASSDDSLWLGFGTIGGVARIRRGELTIFDERDGLAGGDVNGLIEGADGAIWVGSFAGLSRFKNEHWERYGTEHGLPTGPILGVFEDSRRNLWIGTDIGVYRLAPEDSQFRQSAPFAASDFAEDLTGAIWACDAQGGIRPLKRADESAENFDALAATFGRALLVDASGDLWVGTRSNGVIRVRDPARSMWIEHRTRSSGLGSDEIRTLFEARDGSIWIGTRLGLSRLSDSNVRVAIGASETDPYVYAVASGVDGRIWIATDEGLRRHAPNGEQNYLVADGLPGAIVTALHEDRKGALWIATTQGLARWRKGQFEPLATPQTVVFAHVRALTTDSGASLWGVDSMRGVFRWQEGTLTRMSEMAGEGPPYVIYADRRDRVWVGFWTGGLAVYENGAVTRYSDDDGLPSGIVNVIYEDLDGSIWVGTSKGLGRLERDLGRFTTYSQNGFPQATVVSIIQDEQGNYWFGTGVGIVRSEKHEFARVSRDPTARLRYRRYGREDGLSGTLGRPGTPASTWGAGRLWFVTSDGLVVVNPNRLIENPAPPVLRVEGIRADGNWFEPTAQLRLPPQTSRVEIEYSILHLTGAAKVRTRYRLEGFDEGWQEPGVLSQQVASYTNLSPGAYAFHVVSSDQEGGWSDSGAVFAFSIMPALYQTTSFYVAVVLSAVLTLWLAWKLRVNRLSREFRLVLAERARVGRELHDTLLQSLVGVALEFDDISDQLKPSDLSLKRQVARIRSQVEHYIREARQSIWNLRSPTLQTDSLPTALRRFGEAAVAGTTTRFEFSVTGLARRLAAELEEQLLRIGQEAVTNAARHAKARLIRMEISYDDSEVTLRVSDNGCGFDTNKAAQVESSHWGVANMRERAERVGARFTLISEPDEGTTVETVASRSEPHGATAQ